MTIRICGDVEMEKIRIGDVCDILNGYAFKSENYARSGIRIIRISNVQKGYIEDTTPAFYPIETADLDRFMLEQGDLLVSLTGNVGRVAILGKELLPAALNQRVACLRLKSDKISKNYLFHILNSNFFEQQCIMASNGVAQKNLSTEWLKNYEVPCYERDQQEKIVMVLSTIQSVILGRKHELQKLDDLVKARFVELFGMINEDVSLSYYIASLNAGKSLAGEEENPNKVLKTGAVTYDYFDATQIKNLPMDYEPQEGHRVKVGDVIISRMNTAELVGAAAYVWDVPEHIYLPDRLWRAEIKETANPIFVWQVLIQRSTKKSIRRIASGTSGSMKNISKPGLLGIRVVKAPIKLQEQFAAFVEQTDKSKVAVQKALDEAQLLFDSLMQKYFG